jgi:hypothetical protein
MEWSWPNLEKPTIQSFLPEETVSVNTSGLWKKFVREDDDGSDQDAEGCLLDFCCGALMGKNIQHNASSGADCTNKMKRFARN